MSLFLYNSAMKEELKKLGFEGHQAEIYLALVDLEQCGAGDLIKKTGLHRNIVYETLDRLIAKRLVLKVILKNVFQYRITDPNRIIEEQKTNLVLAESIIPNIKKRAENKSDIMVWDGLEGFRNFRMHCIESLKPGGTLYVFGAVDGSRWSELMGPLLKTTEKLRLKKKITYKLISYKRDLYDESMVKNNQLYDIRIIENNFNPPANVIFWEDNVAMQIYEEPISVIEIKNKALAQTYENYFETMWRIGKAVE